MWMLEQYYEEITRNHPDRTQIQPVNITAAANWYFEDSPKEIWDIRDDFPFVVPPFPSMWMEYKSPKRLNINGQIKTISPLIESIGCMSFAYKVAREDSRLVIERDFIRRMLLQIAADAGTNLKGQFVNQRNLNALAAGREAHWIAVWHFFASTKIHGLFSTNSVAAYIDPEGKIVSENYIVFGRQNVLEYMGTAAAEGLNPILFATSLMHAKNVSLEPDPLPAAVAKRRAKEGKPTITFKVLQINPIRRQADKEHSPGETGAKRAMHIVRGHFKDYRDGTGLFGKLKGLYWWDMHVAGDKANGQVIKDYTIAKVSG